MQGRTAVPASTSSPVRNEEIEAEPKSKPNPNHVACAAAIVDNPGRAYTTVSYTGPKTDGFADQLQPCAEPEGIDHSHLMPRFEHWANDPRIAYRSINAQVRTVDKARRSGVRSQNVLSDSSGLPVEIAPDRVERA